jgi:hypothetical protein
MKNFIKLSLFLSMFSGITFANNLNDYLEFYMGVDSQIRATRFKKGFGENLFHKTHPQGNIYIGFKLSDHVNLEIGHESTITRTCTSALTTGESCLGVTIPTILSPCIFKTKLKIKGPHFSLVFSYPIKDSSIKLLGGIGISSIKGTAERKTISFSDMNIQSGTVRTMSKHKEALRFMGGVQYLTKSGLGFRGTLSFVKTRKIIIKKNDECQSIHIPMIKLKDSLVYGLGAFWVF